MSFERQKTNKEEMGKIICVKPDIVAVSKTLRFAVSTSLHTNDILK